MALKNETFAPGSFLASDKIKSTIVEVEFGSPMKNCLHYGICRVTIPAASAKKPCSCRSLATIQLLDKNLLQFVFDKNKMNHKTFEKYFKSGFFQVDDGYEMPSAILEKINLEKYTIKNGRYPVLKNGDTLKVVF